MLFVGGLTAFNDHPVFRRVFILAVCMWSLSLIYESRKKGIPIFNTMRNFSFQIGLGMEYHAFVLYVVGQTYPLKLAIFSVMGVVCMLVYFMTIPFTLKD